MRSRTSENLKFLHKQEKLEEQRERILREAKRKSQCNPKRSKGNGRRNYEKFPQIRKRRNFRSRDGKRTGTSAPEIKDTFAKSSLIPQKPKKTHKPSDFKLGESVRVLSMNLTGTVSPFRTPAETSRFEMGILRSQVNISDLEIIDEQNPYAAKRTETNRR